MRHCLPALALITAGTSLGAQDVDRPGFWSFITAENIATAILQQALSTARMAVDLRYDALNADPINGSYTLTGLVIDPRLPDHAPGQCTISATRVAVQMTPMGELNTQSVALTLTDAIVDYDCLPQEAQFAMGMARIEDIEIGRATLNLDYHIPSGGAQLRFEGGVEGAANIVLDADIHYISPRMDFYREYPLFELQLDSARLQIEDLGALDSAKQILPPEMMNPDAVAAMVQDGGREFLLQETGRWPDGALTQAERNLVHDASEVAAAVAAGAGRVVLETYSGDQPIRISEETMTDLPNILAMFKPQISLAPSSETDLLTKATLEAGINSDAQSPARLAVAEALLSGIGAPRNPKLGLQLLETTKLEDHPDLSLLVAEALHPTNPVLAYGHALLASAAGAADGLSLADAIERDLQLDQILAIQTDLQGDLDIDIANLPMPAEMRVLAQEALIGMGTPRNYPLAYAWASLAAATGDSAAAGLRADIEILMEHRGFAEDWREVAEEVDSDVFNLWLEADVPATLQEN